MMMPQVHHSLSSSQSLLIPKTPLLSTQDGNTSIPIRRKFATTTVRKTKGSVGLRVNAILNPFPNILRTSNTIDVRAVVSVKIIAALQPGLTTNVAGLTAGVTSIATGGVTNIVAGVFQLELISTDGKTKVKATARPMIPPLMNEMRYEGRFDVPPNFGQVGAVVVQNELPMDQYMNNIVIRNLPGGTVTISCNSFVHSRHFNPEPRVFFTNKSYLPSDTPDGLKGLREQDLKSLRGDGKGVRQTSDRIYDYDTYNDLGSPDSDTELARPVLGGSERPYPRRCRTGRAPTRTDPSSESRPLLPPPLQPFYVPRDENFSLLKSANFGINALSAVLSGVIPTLEKIFTDKEGPFPHFTRIDNLYQQGVPIPADQGYFTVLPRLVKTVEDGKNSVLRYETPELMDRDRFAWATDEEFSRQTLAGLNPYSIQLVKEWPIKSKLDENVYGPAESAITKEIVERAIKGDMTLDEALAKKKLFLLDYHDLLVPYVQKVRELKNSTLYGSRTLFFQDEEGTLLPIAIELTRPQMDDKPQWRHVFTPGWDATNAWLWKFAKAHVLSHDSAYHQLVIHWLRTHCCTEPYIIAANRQLSAMHPVYRLLNPYFRYTMEINALARALLINANGVIESTFAPGKYSLELCSAAYDQIWRFDMEALPADLIRRGMAEEDPTAEHGLKLAIEDYPFANDALLLWDTIKTWVSDYVNYYYSDDKKVEGDAELQEFWTEVRTKGHPDKKDEPWWPVLNTRENLIQTLTTIIWVTSGHHAAVNFGQYGYGGYFPNRITIARTNVPVEDPSDEEAVKEFMKKPEWALLKCFPSQIQATKVMSVLDTLSNHSPDEEYIGEKPEPSWADDRIIKAAFERYSGRLMEIEGIIDARNVDLNLKNRCGAGLVPYELLKPTSGPGATMKGVPNSISI